MSSIADLTARIRLLLTGDKEVANATKSISTLGKSLNALKNTKINIGKNLNIDSMNEYRDKFRASFFDKLAVGGAIVAPIKLAIDFEKAGIEASKYLDMTKAEQDTLNKNILSLSTKMPTSAVDLYGIATAGGQLGVAKKDILGFTEGVGKISLAFNIGAEETGDSVAKMMNVFKLSSKDAMLTADAINHITDKVEGNTAKAGELLNVTQRTGGIASLLKISATNTAALGSAFLSTGQTAEVASTGINALLTRLGDPQGQNKDFQAGLERIGLSAKGLKDAVDKDATGAIVMFMKQINKLPKENQLSALSLLFGAEYADNIALVAGNTKILEESLKAVSDKTKYAGSAEKEFQKQMKSTDAQLKILKNSIFELGINIGSELLPIVTDIVIGFKDVFKSISAWTRENKALAKTLGIIIGGGAALSLTMSGLGYAGSFLVSGLLKVTKVAKLLRNPMSILGGATCEAGACAGTASGKFGALKKSIGGIGALGFAQIAGIVALGGAFVGLNIQIAQMGKANIDSKHIAAMTPQQLKENRVYLNKRLINSNKPLTTVDGAYERIWQGTDAAKRKELQSLQVANNRRLKPIRDAEAKYAKAHPRVAQTNHTTINQTVVVNQKMTQAEIDKITKEAYRRRDEHLKNTSLKGGR